MFSQKERAVREFKLPVEQSISAYIVPDSLGVLAPDEIFVSFSGASGQGPIDPTTRCPMTHLLGPCLGLRSPCKLPTDVRLFNAVYKHELSHLTDCIVMSASKACTRSPASILAGGDYDGDTVQLFWDPLLLEHFSNADLKFADTPNDFVDNNFKKELVKVSQVLEGLKVEKAGDEMCIRNIQEFLLGAVMSDNSTSHCELCVVHTFSLSPPILLWCISRQTEHGRGCWELSQ
jgi:hypothetical protein